MHQFVALLQHIHRELYLLGPAIVPVTLSKYRMICAALICGLCVCAAIADSVQRRWIAGALWLVSGGLLVVSFRADSLLWDPQTGPNLAGAAIGIAVVCVLLAFWHELQRTLENARRERRKYRQVPGTSGSPVPGSGPRQTRNSSR
jgi:hypothetical protein